MRLIRTLVICLLPAVAAAQRVETIHRFDVPPSAPMGGLVDAGDGFLYGTTSTGGPGGTIFRVPVAGGPLTIVHRFERGRVPNATLTVGTGGAPLYNRVRAGLNSEILISNFGILRLKLDPALYEWQFMDMNGNVLDRGLNVCH